LATLALATVVLLVLSSLAAPTPSPATEVWEKLLSIQLKNEMKCILAETMFVREMPLADGIVLSGRARCFDGREFDFSQSKPHMRFDLKTCDPVVCSIESGLSHARS
jgi:hypothetical protein